MFVPQYHFSPIIFLLVPQFQRNFHIFNVGPTVLMLVPKLQIVFMLVQLTMFFQYLN